MEPKLITSKAEYIEMLAEVERLVAVDPKPGSSEGDRLSLLAMLVQTYEKEKFLFDQPDPIDAIIFRMEEQGLTRSDLIPYIGSKSKVSEILSRKRPLTLSMIRALHAGLEISAEVLLHSTHNKKESNQLLPLPQTDSPELDWKKFPIKEMIKRGWISSAKANISEHGEALMKGFLAPLNGHLPQATWRRTRNDSSKVVDSFSLFAWAARVIMRAQALNWSEPYKAGTVTKEFLQDVVRLSWSDQGPVLVQEFLSKHGIALIIEPHLPQTKLDGGSMLLSNGRPVIGMTLRFDRIDHFWFTLIHELVHIQKHLKNSDESFFDDLESDSSDDPREKEADSICKETLISRSRWVRSEAFRQRTATAVVQFAKESHIHPAIVAGRIRSESNNYNLLNELIGNGKVRNLFPETSKVG